jgi:probable F420-dependent oxidoreductase
MQLAFPMPNQLQLEGLTMPWETAVTGSDQTRLAKWADQLGYAMISVPEHHVLSRAHLERTRPHHFSAYSPMAYFAGTTESIRVNSSVALLPLQHPVVAAKALSTMDWLSSGRVTVTFGVGWLREEFDALGVPFEKRGAIADEYVRAIIELWTSETPEFEGEFVSFKDVAFEPKCFQTPHVPIWFGGDADPMLRRVARHGAGWWPFLTKPEDLPARIDFIKSQPDYNGKLAEIFLGMSAGRIGAGHTVDETKGHVGQGKQAIIDHLSWYSELGVTMSAVSPPPIHRIEEFQDYTQWVAEEIMPVIR